MNHCILNAEDDSNDVLLTQLAFKQARLRVELQFVADGVEAINYMTGNDVFANRLQYPIPSLVLLDLKLPRKTGLDVLEWMRQQPLFCCTPVIVFSASSQTADVTRARQLGANSYLVKPIRLEERTKLVRDLVHYWLNVDEQWRVGAASKSLPAAA